jgi:hypothetical protein
MTDTRTKTLAIGTSRVARYLLAKGSDPITGSPSRSKSRSKTSTFANTSVCAIGNERFASQHFSEMQGYFFGGGGM